MAVSLRRQGLRLSLIGEAPPQPDDGAAYVNALSSLSAEREPFLLLVDIGITIDLTPEQRKAQNLWYKADRKLLETHCRAMAMVRLAADADMQRVWQSLFAFPVLVTSIREDADAFLDRHATERPGDGSAS